MNPPRATESGSTVVFPIQFTYVLTSDGRDVHADMTYVSMAFLKRVHPEARVLLLCDARSHGALVGAGHPVLGLADEVVPVETPEGSPGYRNRSVKTRQRQIVGGDFVYLDADTLVIRRLDEMLACASPVAGVTNFNGTNRLEELTRWERDFIREIGWPDPEKPFVNGGVLLLRDHPATHRFGALWHERWQELCRATGRHYDQPALNRALCDSGVDYALLNHRFNAQVIARPRLAPGACVWHFFNSMGEEWVPYSVMDVCLTAFQREGRLDDRLIDWVRRRRRPWVYKTVVDYLALWSLERDRPFDPHKLRRHDLAWLARRDRTLRSGLRDYIFPRAAAKVRRVFGRLHLASVAGRSSGGPAG